MAASTTSGEIEAVRDALRSCLDGGDDFVELRYHAKLTRLIAVEQGRVESATIRRREGTGVRVLAGGTFGFASCGSAEPAEVKQAIDRARAAARASAVHRRDSIKGLAWAELARGHFALDGVTELSARSIDEKIALAHEVERSMRASSSSITSASCSYSELYEQKAIVTSDGADCSFELVRPAFWVSAVAERDGERQMGFESVGRTGGWSCLFDARSAHGLAEDAARMAVDLLSAKLPEGGRARVILAPSIVGCLVHEAIGHTVEADYVASGSVAAGRLGQRVGSELVNLYDSGRSELAAGAGGTLPVDDEGVPTRCTKIIEAGILRSYLHDRESAARFGVEPTGNARAWEYSDSPLIRMRNTYIVPGDRELDEMISEIDDGYLLDGARNGQADSTGEFTFGVSKAWRIRNGKRAELVRGMTITGIAFDVMRSVDAISRDFRWDLAAGHCSKGQLAKVDAGGPYLRCEVLLGGKQ
jgi:TldD protein